MTPQASAKIRIMLAEDQAMIRGALTALLELEPDLQVVAEADNGKTALELALKHKPDVLLTDIEMPQMTGLELAEQARQQVGCKIIIVTTFARAGYLQRALAAGASGYLLKDSPSRELADAIRRVHIGAQVINPLLAAEALTDHNPLTDREREVLRLAADGASSGHIAQQLDLSKGTVRNHLSQAISKLDARNRVDAARIAREKGWI